MDFRLRTNKFNNDDLNLWYINIFIFICFLFSSPLVCIFIYIIFKFAYIISKYDSEELELDFYDNTIEDEEFLYCDQDVDPDYLEIFEIEEDYLIGNCHYWFDHYGGKRTVSDDDYYILNNVYKNIYKELRFNIDFNLEDKDSNDYINFIEDHKASNYYNFWLDNLDLSKYNIITKTYNVNKLLKSIKKIRYEKFK